jgi:hypothetical protein
MSSHRETATIMLIAVDRQQARVLLKYILAFLEGVPMLSRLIVRKAEEEVDLSTGITVACTRPVIAPSGAGRSSPVFAMKLRSGDPRSRRIPTRKC